MDYTELQEDLPKRCYRSIFFSDIHLGARGCQAERLMDVLQAHRCLQAHPCETLYLVGDIVDGWRLKSSFLLAAITQQRVALLLHADEARCRDRVSSLETMTSSCASSQIWKSAA